MGGMNEHVVCACGISTTERITGESTRCAPLFLVSIPCHLSLSLSLSPLSLSWYRTVYNLGRLQCACLRHKYRHLLPTTPLHSMRHGLIHSHSSRESLRITRSTNIFKLLYGYPCCSFIVNRIFSITLSFSTCTYSVCSATPSGSEMTAWQPTLTLSISSAFRSRSVSSWSWSELFVLTLGRLAPRRRGEGKEHRREEGTIVEWGMETRKP